MAAAGGHLSGQVQGTGLGRGGNQPVFHPGYGGGDRSAGRRGGVRGRPAAWRGRRGSSVGGRFFGGRATPF